MTATRLAPLLVLAALGGACAAAADPGPAPYIRQRGPARLAIEGGTPQGGKLEVPLSGTLRVVLSVEGGHALEVETGKAITTSEGWSVSPSGQPQRSTLPEGRVRWQQEFLLSPAKPGALPLAIAPLRYREAAGAWKTIAWGPVPVLVTTEVDSADLKQLHDIPGPLGYPPPPPWPRWPLGVAIGLALAAAGVVLWRLRRRPGPEAPPPSPTEWALGQLDRLDQLNLPGQGEINRYFTLLSDTLRRYLELRFQLRAPRQTTAEFLQTPETTRQLSPAQQELLRDFLQRCDLAKFARAPASPEECRSAADLARLFIAETSPATPAGAPPA
jgi:hypothetical protein